MSRTAIFMTNTFGRPVTVSDCDGHIELVEKNMVVANGATQVLIASIGDPSNVHANNTGTITLSGDKADGSVGNCNVELKKHKKDEMEFVSMDNNRLFGIVCNNDFSDDSKSIYSKSLTMIVSQSPYYRNPPS
jgi:hypothetical protein